MPQPSDAGGLSPMTIGFTLAAAVTVVFNTALAWAKDAYAPLSPFMASLTGHHWTTHGLADLAVFLILGFIFARTRPGKRMSPAGLRGVLIGSVTVATVGLVVWFVFV
jgi:hypothetical protein